MPAQTAVDRGRDVRQKLLRAATELIPELGWHAVSTRTLAERAGVGPGLVHYHFQSLQALLREAAVGTMRHVLDSAKPALERADTPEAGLSMMLSSLDAYSGTDPTSLLAIETYLAGTRDEELRSELTGLVMDFQGELARWLAERGRDMPEETASVVAAAIDGVLLHRAFNPALTSAAVAPVLRRLLTRPAERTNDEGKDLT